MLLTTFRKGEGYVIKPVLEYYNSYNVGNPTKKKQARLKFSMLQFSHLKNWARANS